MPYRILQIPEDINESFIDIKEEANPFISLFQGIFEQHTAPGPEGAAVYIVSEKKLRDLRDRMLNNPQEFLDMVDKTYYKTKHDY